MSGAKAQGVSRSGISNGIPIALVLKVTFAKKSYQSSLLDPQRVYDPLPFKNARFVVRF
jgi:hypothetical protein